MEHYFGAHYDSYNLIESAQRIKDSGGNLIQIFLTLPGNIKTEEKSKEELNAFGEYIKKNNMKVIVHSSYIHNIARKWDEYSWWLKNLEIEIKYAHMIGAYGVVLHFGKQLDLSIEEAYNNMYTSLLYIHNKTKDYKDILILLETSTGQGSEMCYKLEDLSHFYKKFSNNINKEIKNRIKLCIDSCHIFAAGYNLKTKKDVKIYLEAFEELVGLQYVKLIHLNDCKVDVGGQRDRHDNIGKGYIGFDGLKYFYDYFKKLNVPIVLETPNNGYKMEIKLLKSS
ncbi:Ap endonuclease 2 [Fadolivirus algeromassiliense]|jgi:deoxyribonuclease-4|uniref:Ap endonuclease 2 n=1 Tax=Fadolivirus FV1/VV64 TaxID=3070911 RepID=A0A7D3V7K4_9VIRU|nr:Ap endonuclease 2 [Fadolivirus algeromassiliense]QKF93996.1 Ap endonuclease 2 [Fadolivirus FV1/VV64]